MNEKYNRLCAGDRKVIYNMGKAGSTQAEIGQAIGCSQGTVSKEISRNRGQRGYRPKQADDRAWTELALSETEDGRELMINQYFAENPQMILLERGLYGRNEASLAPDGRDLEQALQAAIIELPQQVYRQKQTLNIRQEREPEVIPEDLKENAFHLQSDGRIGIYLGGEVRPVEGLAFKTQQRIKGLISVRNTTRISLASQLADDDEAIVSSRNTT